MTCAGMFLLILALFLSTTCCLGNGSCSRNDCTIPARNNREEIKCSLQYEGSECSTSRFTSSNSFPPMPNNLDVKVYKVGGRHEFNITWQPGIPSSDASGDLQYLQGYQINILKLGSANKACYEMVFTNWSQLFNKDKDGNLTLYSDCGFIGGVIAGVEYYVSVTSFPVPRDPSTHLAKMIKIETCGSFSVPNGNVAPSDSDFYEGDIATITCIDGYKLEGYSSIQCLKSNWNPPVPKCIKITVDFEVFTNNSVLVNYSKLLPCSKYRVRLRTPNRGPAEYAYDTDEPVKMYDYVEVGEWQACVRCTFIPDQRETCSEWFNIFDHTPEPTRITTTTTSTTAKPTNSTVTPSTASSQSAPSSQSIHQQPSTSLKSDNKSVLYIYYAIAGCAGGIILISIIFLLRRWQYNPHQSTLRDTEDSRILTVSSRSSSPDENNVVVRTESELAHKPPDVSHPDAITINSSMFVDNVPINTPAHTADFV